MVFTTVEVSHDSAVDGCHIVPLTWESRSLQVGNTQGSSRKREIRFENHVCVGQLGAIKTMVCLSVRTLSSTVCMRAKGRKRTTACEATDVLV